MSIKVLGNWIYKPEFMDNKTMTIEFKRLSGIEEMAILRNENRADDAMLVASIVEIRNPAKLEMPDGTTRAMTKEDIGTIPELTELYYELFVARNNNLEAGGEAAKKPE